jgi:hypothetical protein
MEHPDITNPPEPDKMPVCPVCGEECETYYVDKFGDIFGCENCVTIKYLI